MDDREPQSSDAMSSISELSDEHADVILRSFFGQEFLEGAQQRMGFLPRLRQALKIALADPCTWPPGRDVPGFFLIRGHIWKQLGRQDLALQDFTEFHAIN